MLVVDASVVAPLVADGGPDGAALRERLRGERIAGPDLLRLEVMSVVRRQLLAGELDTRRASHAIDDLLELPLVVYPSSALLRRAWSLREIVTPYDACYVALAEALDCTLLTADARLGRAPGSRCAIEVVGG